MKLPDIEYLFKLFEDKITSLTLYYRGSRDGWMSKHFHRKCDGKGATISLLQIENGDCIGGFTNKTWASLEDYKWKIDASAMLFNLT